MEKTTKSLSVIIPAFNESRFISKVVSDVETVLLGYPESEIIVIDDGSYDYTYETVRTIAANKKNIKVFRFPKNIGKSYALTLGFSKARCDIVIAIDGDNQFDPKDIPRFVDKIEEGCDFVNGYIVNKYHTESKIRLFNSKMFNFLSGILFGIKLRDANCGFKAIKRKIAQKISIRGGEHRYLPYLVHSMGFKVGEIPVKYKVHSGRESRYNPFLSLLDGFVDLFRVRLKMSKLSPSISLLSVFGLFLLFVGFIMGAQSLIRNINDELFEAIPYVILTSLILTTGFISMVLGFLLNYVQDIEKRIIMAESNVEYEDNSH